MSLHPSHHRGFLGAEIVLTCASSALGASEEWRKSHDSGVAPVRQDDAAEAQAWFAAAVLVSAASGHAEAAARSTTTCGGSLLLVMLRAPRCPVVADKRGVRARSHLPLRVGVALVVSLTIGSFSLVFAQAPDHGNVWTDPLDRNVPVEFALQGEYVGEGFGAQVIALGQGQLQAVLLPGGLPGAGWDGSHRILMQGEAGPHGALLCTATGSRHYLGNSPGEFSATCTFPPVGQQRGVGRLGSDGVLMVSLGDEAKPMSFKKIMRASDRLGARPPSDALVLFDGRDTSAWEGGRLDPETRLLNNDGKDIATREAFNDYTAHVEFMLPFRPDARGQARGNSGMYQVHHYELQILDSFGLEGKENECGAIYAKTAPRLNMCYPPLTWQAYDVEFTNAVLVGGHKTRNARITVRHNGVVIHEACEIAEPTGGHRKDHEGTAGPILLQGHGNPIQFRNIWVVRDR